MDEGWLFDKKKVNAFLSFLYVPKKEFSILEQVVDCSREQNLNESKDKLIEKGKRALREGFREKLSKYPDDVVHIVPLSGGVDSRTILGFLLNNVDKSKIVTITFGTPGAMDFEIGQKVAEKVGVKNYPIDLTPETFDWTEEFLLSSARETSHPTILFRAREAFKKSSEILEYDNSIYWSGFMGGALAGSTLPESKSETWDEAIDYFLTNNYHYPNLASSDFDPQSLLPKEPTFEEEKLSYDEQLDYGIRQAYNIRPSAVPNEKFETAYLTKPWLDFILNIPRKHRINKSLFKEIITNMFPTVFSVETMNNFGLPLSAHPTRVKLQRVIVHVKERIKKKLGYEIPCFRTNHFDWDLELRRSDSFREFIEKQLEDLDERDQIDWIKPSRILRKHLEGEDYGTEIRALTSLEIFYKKEEI